MTTARGTRPTDFFDLIGSVRRMANIAARPGQMDQLQACADGLVQWQLRLKHQLCKAVGVESVNALSWDKLIERIAAEHRRAEGIAEIDRAQAEEATRR